MEGPPYMNQIIETIFSVVLICMEVWMIVYMSNAFFKKACSKLVYQISTAMLYIGSISILLLFNRYVQQFGTIKITINVIIILLWLLAVYRCNIIKCFFYSVFVLSYFSIIDGLFMLVSPSLKGSLQFALENPYAYFALCCSMKTAEVLGVILIHYFVKKHFNGSGESTWKDWVRVTFFPLSSLIIAFLLARILVCDLRYSKELAGCLFVMLIIDVISVYFLKHLEESQRAIRDNAILRQNLKLESEHIASLQDNYEQQRKQTHEFYNQLTTLQGLAERKVPLEQFSHYLGTLLATKSPVAFYINTHRTVVDVILSQKILIARDNGIDFQLQLEDLSRFPLPDDALVVILTNLIDNAIEACEKIPFEERRYIQLTMKTEGKTAWLCIENTTVAPVNIRDNYVVSTKGDPLLHGYGLKNISTLLCQHKGNYVLDYRNKDSVFCFYSTIPIIA